MSLKKFGILVLALTFCGCEAQKAAEPDKVPVSKDTPAQMKGNVATVSEPP
jgi:hypothetical protein